MLPRPIFRREAKAAAGRNELLVPRTVLALKLGVVVVLVGLRLLGPEARDLGIYEPAELTTFGGIVFASAIGIEVLFLSVLTASAASESIAEEREKDTLALLLLTRLTRIELIATKLTGRLMPSLLLMLTGLPLILGSAWFAGLPVLVLVEALATTVTTMAVAGSLGMLSSARRDRSGSARGEAIAWTIMWLGGVPFATLLPVRSGTLWGDLLVELRRLASWIAPSSPASLLTDPSWFSRTGTSALSDRLITMMVLHAVGIVLALGGAVACLKLREPRPNWWDPHRGYRPPVSDDPIFWREYVLPLRGSRLPVIVMLARRLLILLRLVFVLTVQSVFLALALAVPIGLFLGAGWCGYFAFREFWDPGSSAAGSYQARDRLNLFIRAVTGIMGLAPLLGVTAGVTGRLTIERAKKTWESLLTTPLTGAEILSAKMRATAWGLRSVGCWLILLWVLGIVCGGLHPLGALVAAVGLPMLAWAGLALGTWLAIRPGSTQAASSASALGSLGLMLLGGLMIVAPLCSGRELAELGIRDARLIWLTVGALLASALMTGAFAWSLTRRCFRRFDQWVGRPHRAAGTGPGQAVVIPQRLDPPSALGRESRPASASS